MKDPQAMNIRDKKTALLILPVAIMSVSTAAIFIRYAQETITSKAIAAYRLIIASLILIPFTIKKTLSEIKSLDCKSIGLILISGLLLASHFESWIISLEYTDVISSVVLVTTTPIWVTAVSPWLMKEKIPKRFIYGLLLALIGIMMISFWNSRTLYNFNFKELFFKNELGIQGNLLALLGAFCAAGYLIIGKMLRKQISAGSYSLTVYSIAGVVLLMFALLSERQSIGINLNELKILVMLALIPQVIGHSLINWSLGLLPAYYVAISLLGEPIGSTILAIVLFKEIPTNNEIISAVIILLGIFVAMLGPKNESGREKTPPHP